MRSNVLVYTISIITAMVIGWTLFNPDYGTMIQYILMLLFYIIIAWFILVAFVTDQKERNFLISLFLLALALRIVVSLLLHTIVPRGYFAPDETLYIDSGKALADSWAESTIYTYTGSKAPPQTIVSAILFYMSGNKLYVALLFENFIGALTVLNIYFITKRFFNRESARYASVITAIFPSLVLWSSLLLKDPNTQFLISFAVLLTLRLKERLRMSDLILLIGSVILVGFFRSYLILIVSMAIGTSFISFNKDTFIRNFFILIVFSMGFALFFSVYETKNIPKYETNKGNAFQSLQQIRSGFYQGGSKILGNINVSTPINALKYFPLLIIVFYLAPFPWDITGSMLHNLATMESLLWYYLLYYAIKGIIRALKEGNYDVMPVLVMIGVLSVAYALAISNIGAAYRFRAQVSVLLMVFSGYGLYLRKQEHLKKYALPI